jgi:ribosomal protein S18 acetylase RimI-like enzyme
MTDVLGDLLSIDERELTVRGRDGVTHRIPLRQVTAAKRIPPRPTSFSEIAALEWVSADGLPAPETARLGDWLLRAAQGWSNRGNSALPVGDPGMALEAAVDAVEAWYRERDLHPRVSVPLPLCRRVDDLLAARGWTARVRVLVEVADLSDIVAAVPAADEAPPDLRTAASPEFLALVSARKGAMPAAAHHLLTASPHVCFAHQYARSGALAGIARGVVAGDGRWLGLTLVETLPEVRRQGVAQRVLASLAGWAMGLGATRAYLQVDEDNEAARSLYRRLGFTTHHSFVVRYAP